MYRVSETRSGFVHGPREERRRTQATYRLQMARLLGTWRREPRSPALIGQIRGVGRAKNQHASALEREKGRRADIDVHVRVLEGRREDALRVK